jgi:hypothetical protein
MWLLLLFLQDRLTMLPFLLSFIDYDASPEVYERCVFGPALTQLYLILTNATDIAS